MSDVEHDLTAKLAATAAGLRYEDVPTEVIAHAKLCLLDTVACGLHGSTLPWVGIVRDTIAEIDRSDVAAVWGTELSASVPNAALVNAMAVHAFELDDLHRLSIVHPGSVVVPAALAIAEGRQSASGRDLLTAMVAGYEVAARVGMALGASHLVQGWHPTGTHGTLGAAASACSMLGLSAHETLHALGTAGSQSSGLMASQFSSMVKRFHAGHAAHAGVISALLAARGFLGIPDLLENPYGGYLATFAPRSDPERILDGLGVDWQLASVGFKPYSTNGSCHPTIDALLEMRAQSGLRAADVDTVLIRCSTATYKHVGWPYRPDTVTTAQMNLPYIVAVTLTDGDAFIEQFTTERVRDPALVELSGRVVVEPDPEIDEGGDAMRHRTKIEVRLRGGRRFVAERHAARGSSVMPMTPHEVDEKFAKLATTVFPADRAEQLRDMILSIDDLARLTDLTRMMNVG